MSDPGGSWLLLGVLLAAGAVCAAAGYAGGCVAGFLRGADTGYRRGVAAALRAIDEELHERLREALADELGAARFEARRQALAARAGAPSRWGPPEDDIGRADEREGAR